MVLLALIDCDGTLYQDAQTTAGLVASIAKAASALGVGSDQAKQLYLRYGSTLAGLVAEKLIPAAAAAGFDVVPVVVTLWLSHIVGVSRCCGWVELYPHPTCGVPGCPSS